MKLVEKTILDFVGEVDSNNATPGGGSVSALASSLGVALTRMVGHLTVNKKKFKALDEETQKRFKEITSSFEQIKLELLNYIDLDTDAFNLIMDAFGLPKESPEEISIRKAKILEGTKEAINVPYQVAKLSLSALQQIPVLLPNANKNALSDLGVGALLLQSGIEGAILNVKINISGLNDLKMIEQYESDVQQMLQDSRNIKDNVIASIHNML